LDVRLVVGVVVVVQMLLRELDVRLVVGMVVQMLFRELDVKLDQVTSLLTRATSSQCHSAANSELSLAADRLRATALNTHNAASKSHVS